MESICKILFWDPKKHISARNRVIWRIDRENRCRGLGCRLTEEPKNYPSHLMRIFAYFGARRGNPIAMTFWTVVGVPNVITRANYGNDRFRGFWGSGGRIFPFLLTCVVVLKHSGTTVSACDVSFCQAGPSEGGVPLFLTSCCFSLFPIAVSLAIPTYHFSLHHFHSFACAHQTFPVT